MSKLRSLNTCFWSDPWIEELCPNEKLLFLYLITNSKTNMLGIYESSIKKISFETGIEKEMVQKALKGFERVKKVKYINNHVVLVNYMKHQHYNTNMKKSAIDIYNNLPNELKDRSISVSKDNPLKGFETLLNHYGMVSKVEDEIESKIEDEVEYNFEEDSLYNVDILKQGYLKNDKILQAVINEPRNKVKNLEVLKKYLDLHCSDLIQQGRHSEKWNEFTKYFINSLRSGKFLKNEVNKNNRIVF